MRPLALVEGVSDREPAVAIAGRVVNGGMGLAVYLRYLISCMLLVLYFTVLKKQTSRSLSW